MGKPKLLLPFAGSTVIGCTTAGLQRGGADRVVIVTAPGDDALQDWARKQDCELSVNPDPSRGMLSSIQEGLAALGGPTALEVLLVCPADLPLLRAETVARLLAARAQAGTRLATPVHAGRRGHPLAIAGDLLAEIQDLDPSIGLRQLLLDHPDDLLHIEVDDPGTIRDLDTPTDYRILQAGKP